MDKLEQKINELRAYPAVKVAGTMKQGYAKFFILMRSIL